MSKEVLASVEVNGWVHRYTVTENYTTVTIIFEVGEDELRVEQTIPNNIHEEILKLLEFGEATKTFEVTQP